MLAFPEMLRSAAENAGMAVPANTDEFDKNEFPRFWIFCALQLGQRMPYPSVHFDNAKVIAGLEFEKMKTMLYSDFLEAGFQN